VLAPYQIGRIDRRRGQADLVYSDGTFYLYVTVEVPEPPVQDVPDYLGVDLGIVNLATDSDGNVHTGEAVEHKRRTYAHRRRNLQRRRTRSAKRKLKLLRRRQARYQQDTNHCISKALVCSAKDTGRGIALEDLDGIRDRVSVRRRQRARHSNWSFGQLRAFVQYKARLAGVPVVLVDPRNTSRTCPVCGSIDKRNRPSQAQFACIACGHAGLADAVAARVIAARARVAVMQPNADRPIGKVVGSEHGVAAPATSRLL
jgi:IS605 OrfB family transposase